jgi:uncharacterized protein (DUF1499 family)
MEEQVQTSKIVNWGGYLAVTLLLTLVVSVMSVRAGMWQQGLVLYALSALGAAGVLAVLAFCMALPGFSPWRRHLLIRIVAVLPGTLLFLSILSTRGDYPVIHDITTDLTNPPIFTHALKIRGKSANPLALNEQTIQSQQDAYPDIKTGHSTLNSAEAFGQATAVVNEMGWEITLSDPDAGLIEAVATTAIMAFKDDIAIRLTATEGGTLIDLRSVSRVGKSDLGANAGRIREFMRLYNL